MNGWIRVVVAVMVVAVLFWFSNKKHERYVLPNRRLHVKTA